MVSRAVPQGIKWKDSETPILASMMQMAANHKISLHVPGHKQGRLFPSVLAPWLGQALQLDLTELPGLDNLHHAEGCIAASQRLAASHYGAKETLYSVNGSTAGVMAAILGVAPERKILVCSPFHQSVWKGLVLAGATPVFLPPRYDMDTLEVLPPTAEDVRLAIHQDEEIAAVFVTSPTYPGRIADVRKIANAAHERGIPVIVDEAHGAHLGLIEDLPEHSVSQGADIVVQSVHKMLPGLTQTAWLHMQGQLIDYNRLRHAFLTLQTSSPSYLFLASLDAVQAWLRFEARGVARESVNILRQYPELTPVPHRDGFRKWIPTGSLGLSQSIAEAFQKVGAWVEYADHLGVLLVFGLDVRVRDIERWLPILRSYERDTEVSRAAARERLKSMTSFMGSGRELVANPREVEFRGRERVPLSRCQGRIAGAVIAPYPPGVPMVYPGERLDHQLVTQVLELYHSGYQTIGLDADGTIEVLVSD